ncbi:MAG: ABC transporter permease [Bryobacterales bacterium]|nr:ABC transporter permease [Bryobacterales bacterium]
MHSGASFGEAVRVAFASLQSSKLRSFLTLLGIILATATLIAVMSIIHGMDVYIAQNVSDMGADGFRVVRMAFIGNWDAKKYLELERKNPQLNREEYEFLRQKSQLTRGVGMMVGRRGTAVFGSDKLEDVQLRGSTANVAAMTNVQIELGRAFTDMENARHVPVCIIGADLKDAFFPQVEPVGKSIKIDGRPFTVVGVARKQGSAFGQSLDSFAMFPIEAYFRTYGSRMGISYVLQAQSTGQLFQAQEEIQLLLRAYRQLRPKEEDNFMIVSSDSLVSAWGQMTSAIAATAMAVVSIFMVVGGVVIMNIMLAVVTERTQEIGIRKSVGARRRDIMWQFLVESATLSAVGGAIGVLFAFCVTLAGNAFTPLPMSMPWISVFLGVFLSAAVGLFFGIYPAHRASKLDPIRALQVER